MKFTKDEKKVLVFILIVIFIGISVLYLKKLAPVSRFIELSEKEIKKEKKININKATKEELTKLTGIGPVMAGRIVAYREKNGPFGSEEDIKNVKGIGDKTFEKIKNEILLE